MTLPSERFELLSAYLDGEVTSQERQLVQEWIDHDPHLKQTYLNLLRLQRGIPHIPVSASISSTELSRRVLAQVKREDRSRRYWHWGGVVAATAVAAMVSWFSGGPSPFNSLWQTAQVESESEETLVIALNQPLFELPTTGH